MIADNKEIKKRIIELQAKLNIIFPQLYIDFLAKINDGDVYEVDDSGICLYSYSDLEERNQTYQIKDFEPNYFMIGQDGDLGYFINVSNPTDNSIYSNDLGALGSLEVQIFPESSFYDLQWDLLKLVESVIRIDDGDKYIQLINTCPSQEWKDVLNIRYKNYKKSQEV